MPNTVYNRLVVTGPEDAVQRFADRVISDDLDCAGQPYVLDFARHVPLPADVEDVREWCDVNWGSKQPMWAEITERRRGEVVYTFTTAWTAPVRWLKHTSAAEPDLAFLHEFVEEFEQTWGRHRWERGELVLKDDIDPTDLAWAYESGEEETVDPEATDTAVDVLATAADRVLAAQGLE